MKKIGLVFFWLFMVLGMAEALPFAGGDGSPENPYQISNVEQLQEIRLHLSAHYILINDLDATATQEWNEGEGFEPLGPFSGSLDGKGYTITGLFINRPGFGGDRQGLFSRTASEAKISNLQLVEVNITGNRRVGALVGGWNEGTITNSHSSGTVSGSSVIGGLVGTIWGGTITGSSSTATLSGGSDVGGLVGSSFGGTITNSHSRGAVSGSWDVGGLVGYNDRTIIRDSSSTGKVSGSWHVGGLVGDNWGGAIINSYSTGAVSGSRDDVGGLVGTHLGTIANSFSTGAVSGRHDVGGLVGDNSRWGGGTITNSYSTGAVSGTSSVGGLVGDNRNGTITNSYSTGRVSGTSVIGGLVGDNTRGEITVSFWDIDTSGLTSGVGAGPPAGAYGRATAQMKQQATFLGWDFVDIWNIVEGETYPFHRWAPPPTLSVAPDPSLDFDNVLVGRFRDLDFTVTNTGTGTLEGEASLPAGAFSIVGESTFSLGAGASTTITVRFRPLTTGLFEETVSFTSNGGDLERSLSGRGVRLVLSVTPPSLDFGSVPQGQSRDLDFTVANAGEDILTVSAINVSPPFTITSPVPFSLEAGLNTTVTVRFRPAAAGFIRETVSFISDGGDLTRTVSGTGVEPIPPPPVTNFVARAGDAQVSLSWTNPSRVDYPDFERVRIFRRTDTYPTAPGQPGSIFIYDGTGTSHVDTHHITNGVTYYYTAFTYDRRENYSAAVPSAQGSATPRAPAVPAAPDAACFIATAAYGTPLAEEVEVLSRLRDEHLLTNRWGRRFVVIYEYHSPQWAAYIEKRPALQALVRHSLRPLIWSVRILKEEEK